MRDSGTILWRKRTGGGSPSNVSCEAVAREKARLPATEVSSVSLLASKACRNLLKSLETKAGWSFRVAARRRCGAAEKAARWQKADR